MECEVDEVKIDKPPSPRMTRARKQTMNWTEEEINKVKEGVCSGAARKKGGTKNSFVIETCEEKLKSQAYVRLIL